MLLLEVYVKYLQYLDIKILFDGIYLVLIFCGEDGVVFLIVLNIKDQEVVFIICGKGKEIVSSFDWFNDECLILIMVCEVGLFE